MEKCRIKIYTFENVNFSVHIVMPGVPNLNAFESYGFKNIYSNLHILPKKEKLDFLKS